MSSLIDDLMDPRALPDPTSGVTLVQTHISLVFVGDDYVYKVKKAVDFGFLDFTTLERRRHFCEEEVRLNRRLSRGLYTGVLPVVVDRDRHRIGHGQGTVVDYAVRMRRIPEALLMKSLFLKGQLTDRHLTRLAERLARFSGEAETSPQIERFGEPDRFRLNTDENFRQTEPYVGRSIDAQTFEAIRQWTDGAYRTHRLLFSDRIRQGRIRDCHGDLHMEHVCLADEIAIFDCIEFNQRFRYSDTLSDIAFLLMDLEFHGGQSQSQRLWELYMRMTGETGVEALVTFYKIYRAYVRGKVTSFLLDDARIDEKAKTAAAARARRYFELARQYVEQT
jgi:hypothetical protein